MAYAAQLAERAAQVKFMNPESRIMPVASGGFAQTAKAPATVDRATGLSVGNLRQHPNDPQEGAPALAGIGPLPASLEKGEPAAWDAGVFRAHTIQQCGPTAIEPYRRRSANS